MKYTFWCVLVAALFPFLPARAQQRALSTSYALEAGGEHAFNTYLSPLAHTGAAFGLTGSWERPVSQEERRLSMAFEAACRFAVTRNVPARNADLDDASLRLNWRMNRSFSPLKGLTLAPGAGLQIDGGLLYLPRNSNNPVAARLYAGVTLNGTAAYRFNVKGREWRVLDEVCLPSLGVFFSPHYGQSYYEISIGERSGLARCGWWGNHFAINNLVALEIPVCSIRLRLGYRLEVLNSIASGIHSRISVNSFVLGISTDWVNVTRRINGE